MRRIGVLMYTTADDPESQARIAALAQGLQEAGWTVGRNVRIDVRWSGGDAGATAQGCGGTGRARPGRARGRRRPDHAQALQQATRTVPIVIRPGRRSGRRRLRQEPGAAGRQRHRLYPVRIQPEREMARTAQGGRAASCARRRRPGGIGPVGIGQWAVIEAAASPLGVELSPINLRDRRRDRTRRDGIRARAERRPDRAVGTSRRSSAS